MKRRVNKMKRMIFTPLDYHYEIDSWNPVVETQDKGPSDIEKEEKLSSVERDYILDYKKIWDELSKY